MNHDPNDRHPAAPEANEVLLTMLELAERGEWEGRLRGAHHSPDGRGEGTDPGDDVSLAVGEPLAVSGEEARDVLAYGRRVLEVYLREGRTFEPEPGLLERRPLLRVPRAAFVTLRKEGRLRGCMGELLPTKPLYEAIQRCGIEAATADPRFSAVTFDDLADLRLSISILSFPRKIRVAQPQEYPGLLRPGVDGVILVYRGRQSTFLPSVWKEISDPVEFLSRLSRKQGSPADAWRDPEAVLYRYEAVEIAEEEG